MAKKKLPEGTNNSPNTAAIAPDPDTTIPRIRMGEQGFSAIRTRGGKIYEAANVAFRYPAMLRMVDEMMTSPPVAIGVNAINTLFSRAEVIVEPIVGETDTDKARREYLLSALHDMTQSWQSTMQSIGTYKEYGHSVHEIVLRRRLTANGSKYNDGLVGIEGLKYRPQNSIAKWNFSEDGRQLVSISQSLANLENSARFQNLTDVNGFIIIPREKFILFRCDASSDNPEGNSILKPCYLAYKQLSLVTDQLMTGIAKDVSGVPFAQLPPQYLDPNASDDKKAVYEATKQIVGNISAGTQSGVIFPKMIDPDSKQDMFSFSLLENKSGKAYDLPGVIKMLQSNILSVLSCDSITMGDSGGSLSLQDGSTNLLALQVAYRLSEVANTLNQELVPLLWRMNGWSTDRMPKIAFADISSVSLEEFSKYCQRVFSVGGIEITRDVMNKIREVGGFEQLPEDSEVNTEILSTTLAGKSSSAGQGMAVGVTGDGTSTSPGGKDASAQNADNKG